MRSVACLGSLLAVLAFSSLPLVDARLEPVRFFSDPLELLLQDAYIQRSPSMRQSRSRSYVPQRRISKRRYTSYPPAFYSSGFSSPMNFNRRSAFIPYAELLFNGR